MKRTDPFWKPLARCIATLALTIPVLSANADNVAPTIDDPLVEEDGTTKSIEPNVPVGKTLLIPISAHDADGDALSYKVTSSNPKVMVRVRTGRPHLKLAVDYAGDTSGTTPAAPFSGELDIQLFRDWTPEAAGFIGGFAQSLFYSPRVEGTGDAAVTRSTTFHRVVKDFMVQGGDPNSQIPDPASGTPVTRGPGFSFDDEFGVPMIFTGRGQLAMANSGYSSTYKGTNGSQFFITTGSPRHLDFNHTIFGQLAHGWDVLEKMQNVPVTAQATGGEISRPTTDIRITGTSVAPNFTDGLLVLSATGAGNANITVEVSDGHGHKTQRVVAVKAVVDEHNSPPFFSKLEKDQTSPKDRALILDLHAEDLEQDYMTYANGLIDYTQNGTTQQAGNRVGIFPKSGYEGLLTFAYGVVQFDMSATSSRNYDELRSIKVAVGEDEIRAKAIPVTGAPGVSLSNVAVASYVDTDARGQANNTSASINWGDGSAVTGAAFTRDTTQPTSSGYRISGTHTYQRAGVYPIEVTFTSAKGLNQVVHSTAVITDGSLKVIGEQHTVTGRTFSAKPLATFTDTAGTSAADYEATVDWGDGDVDVSGGGSVAVRQSGAGQLYVTGTHAYTDPETYSVAVRVHRKSAPASDAACAWATLDMNFAVAQSHLPPFPMAHLVASLGTVTDTKNTAATQDDVQKPLRSTVAGQTLITCSLSILNAGNKAAPPSKIRFYLSTDRKLNHETETYQDDSVSPPVTRTRPKDIPLTVGKTEKELKIIGLKPGQGGGINFDVNGAVDTRLYLPKGETGAGYFLLAELVYNDPLADQSPIDHEALYDISTPFSTPASVEVTEIAGLKHTQEFKVKLERRPSGDVTIPLTIVDGNGIPETTELYFTAAPPNPPDNNPTLPPDQNLASSPSLSVTFTQGEWDNNVREKTVSVTGKQDNVKDGDQVNYIQVGPVESDDPRFHGRYGAAIKATTRDRDSLLAVSLSTLTTTEAAGTSHTRTFTIRLNKSATGNKPTADVVVPILNGDDTEGTITASTLTGTQTPLQIVDGKPSIVFSATEEYPATRIIMVTAVDDQVADGNINYAITIDPSTSTDPDYSGINAPDVSVTNIDNPPTTTP